MQALTRLNPTDPVRFEGMNAILSEIEGRDNELAKQINDCFKKLFYSTETWGNIIFSSDDLNDWNIHGIYPVVGNPDSTINCPLNQPQWGSLVVINCGHNRILQLFIDWNDAYQKRMWFRFYSGIWWDWREL